VATSPSAPGKIALISSNLVKLFHPLNKCGGSGGGGGAGGRVAASAVIVIKGEHIQVIQIKKSTSLSKLVEIIPEIADKFKQGKEKGEENKEG